MRKIFSLFRDAFRAWKEDNASRLGAALAYYTVFSIPPLLILLIGLAGLLFDEAQIRERFVGTVGDLVGPQGAAAVRQMLGAAHMGGHGAIATIIGIVSLILGASGVFGNLKETLNTVWEIEPKPGGGIRAWLRKYVFSLMVLLGTGFLLIVSLGMSALLAALGATLSQSLPGGPAVWQALNLLISLTAIAFLFALLYRYIPDARVAWRDALLGGAVTSLLFTGGEALIGFYLGRSNVGSAFGAAGSLAVVLVWVYYSALIFFYGAEFTKAYATRFGARIVPNRDAEPVMRPVGVARQPQSG